MNELDVQDFSISDLRRYLLRKGWSPERHPNGRIEVLKTKPNNDGDFSTVTLPSSIEYSNSASMLIEAFKSIATHENTAPDQLLNRLRRWGKDVLLARLFKIQGNENSLPLRVAAEGITRLKDFIGYAAYTQSEPKPFFDKAGGVSSAFTNQCRFGHTFQGSFGLTIECPVEVVPVLPMDQNPQIIPFERQVFDRIANGLSILRTSIDRDSLDPMLQGYRLGFSANMCRALTETYELLEGRRIEYNILWNPELESANEVSWRPFLFEGRAHEFAREAAKELEKSEILEDSLIEGTIVQLRSDLPPGLDEQAEFEHVITMSWVRERDQVVRIRIPLAPTQYIQACDAHKEGRRIRIYGVPEKAGKYWSLTKPHDFTVLASR